jgi:hypothetical protein
MSTQNHQKLIEQARKNITDAITNLAENRHAIELLTLTKGYKAIFRLKDDDWSRFSKMHISMRSAFEKSIKTEQITDLLILKFGK